MVEGLTLSSSKMGFATAQVSNGRYLGESSRCLGRVIKQSVLLLSNSAERSIIRGLD